MRAAGGLMSEMGHSRRFDRTTTTFAVGTRVTSRPPGRRRQSPASGSHRT